jgi:oxygen-independent coproporphyrinogen-3 oxidase
MNALELIRKYNVPGPRYTSYPTVPFWKEHNMPEEKWLKSLVRQQAQKDQSTLGLYIHLPFCESLCTFCGCHKRITKNHAVELPYIESVLQEWEMYQKVLQPKTQIVELHLGGGTPTFFAPKALKKLITGLLLHQKIDQLREKELLTMAQAIADLTQMLRDERAKT